MKAVTIIGCTFVLFSALFVQSESFGIPGLPIPDIPIISSVAKGIVDIGAFIINTVASFITAVLQGFGSIAVNLYDVLVGLPGGLPAGVILPDISGIRNENEKDPNVVIATMREIIIAVTQILFKGSPAQVSAVLSRLVVIMPELEKVILTLSDPKNLGYVRQSVSLDEIQALFQAFNTLNGQLHKLPLTGEVSSLIKITENILVSLRTLINSLGGSANTSIIDLAVYVGKGVLNVGGLIINTVVEFASAILQGMGSVAVNIYDVLFGLPGQLPNGVVLPDVTEIKGGNVKDPNVGIKTMTETIVTVYQILVRGTPEQVSALISKLVVILPKLQEVIVTLADPRNLAYVKQSVSLDNIQALFQAVNTLNVQLHKMPVTGEVSSLIQITESILVSLRTLITSLGGSVNTTIIDVGTTAWNIGGTFVNTVVEFVRVILQGMGSVAVNIYDVLFGLPGRLPNGVVLPDVTEIKGGNVQDPNVGIKIMTETISTVYQILVQGTPEQVSALISKLVVVLPQLQEVVATLADPRNLAYVKERVSLQSIQSLYQVVNSVNIQLHSMRPSGEISAIIQILEAILVNLRILINNMGGSVIVPL